MTLWCEPVTSLTQHLVTRFDVMMHLQPLSFKKQLICAYPNITWNRRQRVFTGDRVCELLLGGPPREKQSESLMGKGGEMATSSSDLGGARAVNESNGQIAQSSQKLRGVAGAQT